MVSSNPPSAPTDTDASTVGSAELREALEVTPHQLSELTAGLRVDVGPRPNYPRYQYTDVQRMTAVQSMRELRTPLDVALRAANDYAQEIVAGGGWLLTSPTDAGWATSFMRTGPDLVLWLRGVGGRGCVLDLDTIATRATRHWRDAQHARDARAQ